jgi:hypothetical protein
MLRKSHQKVKPIKRSSKKTPKKSSKKTPKKSSKIKSYKFRTSLAKYPSSLSVKSPIHLKNTEYKSEDYLKKLGSDTIATGNVKEILDKIKNGELFNKDEIDNLTEMFKSFGKQIKNKEIRDAFEKVLHFLGTIKEDRFLTSKETSKMIMIYEMVKKRKIGLRSHFTPHTPSVAAEKCPAFECPVCLQDSEDEDKVVLCEWTDSSGEIKTHKVCKSCAVIMVDYHKEITCPICKERRKPPAHIIALADERARALASAPASARGRGPPPAAQRHPANAEPPETLVQIMTMVSALISAWALYMIFWQIPPESLDFFGFCQTVAASTISLLIFLWALGR